MLQVRHQNPFQFCPLENSKVQIVVLSLALTLTQVGIGVEQPGLHVHLVQKVYLVDVMLALLLTTSVSPVQTGFCSKSETMQGKARELFRS